MQPRPTTPRRSSATSKGAQASVLASRAPVARTGTGHLAVPPSSAPGGASSTSGGLSGGLSGGDLFQKLDFLCAHIEKKAEELDLKVEETCTRLRSHRKDKKFLQHWPRVSAAMEIFLRGRSVLFVFLHQVLQLGVITCIIVSHCSKALREAVYITLLILDCFHALLLFLILVELVSRMARWTARLSELIASYLSFVLLFAGIFTQVELLSPGSFSAIDCREYKGYFQAFLLYYDFFYYSNIVVTSVGFGEVHPVRTSSRYALVPFAPVSVIVICVLMSNWMT